MFHITHHGMKWTYYGIKLLTMESGSKKLRRAFPMEPWPLAWKLESQMQMEECWT